MKRARLKGCVGSMWRAKLRGKPTLPRRPLCWDEIDVVLVAKELRKKTQPVDLG